MSVLSVELTHARTVACPLNLRPLCTIDQCVNHGAVNVQIRQEVLSNNAGHLPASTRTALHIDACTSKGVCDEQIESTKWCRLREPVTGNGSLGGDPWGLARDLG